MMTTQLLQNSGSRVLFRYEPCLVCGVNGGAPCLDTVLDKSSQ
jgi:hypothetical protein